MKATGWSLVMFLPLVPTHLHLAHAQSYPEKPVRIIIGQAAGSSTDFISRVIGDALGPRLGQPVIIEPRPGAAGIVGTTAAAKSPPDGYTLTMVFSNPNNVLVRNLPYDVFRDFAPISLVANTPFVLVVNPSLPVRNVQELIRLAKAKPGQIDYSSTGVGSSQHLCGEFLQLVSGIKMTNVPYQGGTPALNAVLAGEVSVMFPTAGLSLPSIRAGKLRPIAVTTKDRSKFLPNVPSIAEAGFSAYHMTSWFGLVAPARTPEAILRKLNSELGEVLRTPSVINLFERQGIETLYGPPEQLTNVTRSDLDKIRQIAVQAGIPMRSI